MSINNDFVLNRFKPRGRPDVGEGETLLAKDLNNQNSGDRFENYSLHRCGRRRLLAVIPGLTSLTTRKKRWPGN